MSFVDPTWVEIIWVRPLECAMVGTGWIWVELGRVQLGEEALKTRSEMDRLGLGRSVSGVG